MFAEHPSCTLRSAAGAGDMVVHRQTRSLLTLQGEDKLMNKNRSDQNEHDIGSCDKGQG